MLNNCRLFLVGLDKFGKGDWRSISRNLVISRTPTEVATDAQKYFIRLNSINRDRRRTSIHDITNGAPPSQQVPITGQLAFLNMSNCSAIGPPMKHMTQPSSPQGMGMYSATGHMPSVIGTTVVLPHRHHPPYAMPAAHPMAPPPPAMHR